MAKKVTYRKEFFDREYTAKEAYGRVWSYARQYKVRIIVGILRGRRAAGTLVPFFQVIQPALQQVESRQEAHEAEAPAAEAPADGAHKDKSAKKAKGLEKDYGKIRKWLHEHGIELQDENEELGLPLLFLIIVVVPVVALFRCGLVFLNHYCLAWAGMRTVSFTDASTSAS